MLFACVLALFSTTMAAETDGDCGEIAGFEFVGLKRTKQSYLFRVLSDFVGEKCDSKTLEKIDTALREQGLFSEIKIEIESRDDDVFLKIALKEKISFLPLPFASYTNAGTMGGAVVMDNNAFGKKDSFFVGGIFSKSSMTAIAAFSKPAVDLKHPGFSISASYAKKDFEIADCAGDVFDEFSARKIAFSASFVEKITADFSIAFAAKYSGSLSVDGDFDDIHQIVFHPSAKWSLSDWNGFFLSEKYVECEADAGFTAAGDFVTAERLRLFFQKPLLPRLRFSVAGFFGADQGKTTQNQMTQNQMTRSAASNCLLPQNFYSPRIFASNLDVECAVLKTKFCTVSLYAAYQLLGCDDCDGNADLSHGPGGGLMLYLEKLNFPACSFGIYYNIPHNAMQFGLSLGGTF